MEVRNVCVGSSKSTIRIVNDDEVHLYNSHPIHGLKFHRMVDLLDDFMATAININTDLTALCRLVRVGYRLGSSRKSKKKNNATIFYIYIYIYMIGC